MTLDVRPWKRVEKVGEATLDGLTCRFGCDAPVYGVYHVPEGCHCWTDPIQALCAQHALTVESAGAIRAIVCREWPL